LAQPLVAPSFGRNNSCTVKTSVITTTQEGVFAGLPAQFTVNRYHSLAIERATCPACLKVTAWTDDGEIMGVRHTVWTLKGCSFTREHSDRAWSRHAEELFETREAKPPSGKLRQCIL
jgi:anthranilate synthase component 2